MRALLGTVEEYLSGQARVEIGCLSNPALDELARNHSKAPEQRGLGLVTGSKACRIWRSVLDPDGNGWIAEGLLPLVFLCYTLRLSI